MGLKEAKDKIEETSGGPVYLFRKVPKAPHQEMVDKLKENGADIDFE